MSRHPLRVVAVVVSLVAIILVKRVLLELPLRPQFHSTFLERLPLEILFLLFFLFQVICGLLFLCGLASPITIDIILLYRRPRGPSVNRALCEKE